MCASDSILSYDPSITRESSQFKIGFPQEIGKAGRERGSEEAIETETETERQRQRQRQTERQREIGRQRE